MNVKLKGFFIAARIATVAILGIACASAPDAPSQPEPTPAQPYCRKVGNAASHANPRACGGQGERAGLSIDPASNS